MPDPDQHLVIYAEVDMEPKTKAERALLGWAHRHLTDHDEIAWLLWLMRQAIADDREAKAE